MKKADDLYVMCNSLIPQIYKIGRAADAQKRACSLMASQPFRIKVVMVFPEFGFLERTIHKSLEPFRVKTGPGVEWFSCELSQIATRILTRLPTYLPQLLTEKGRHAEECVEAASIASGGSSDTAGFGRGSLGGDGVSSVDDVGARAGLATDGPWSPGEIVPYGRQLPVFGEVPVGVLAIGDEGAGQPLDDGAPWQETRAYVFEGPTDGAEIDQNLERFRYQPIGPV